MTLASPDPGGPAALGIPIRLGLVFDLDGTLIDSRVDIAYATNHALSTLGLPALSVAEIASFVGDGARALLARAARRQLEAAEIEQLLRAFLEFYEAHPTDHTLLMPGAHEALSALAHLPLALCTNKPRSTTDAILSQLRLGQTFSVVIAGGDLPQLKPDPLPLLHIAERLELSPVELVMVGDGAQDVQCAKAAGARAVAVEGGIQANERLLASNPDVVLKSLHELPALIESWLNPR